MLTPDVVFGYYLFVKLFLYALLLLALYMILKTENPEISKRSRDRAGF